MYLLAFLLLCLLFYPVCFLGWVFYDADIFQIHIPFRLYSAHLIKDGMLPLWTPQIGCGHPLLADGQAGVFYPLNILFLFLPSLLTFNLLTVFHYFLSGTFMYMFAREIKITSKGAITSAIIFTFSGFSMAHFRHTTIVNVMVWLPLLFYLLERGTKKANIIYFILFSIISSISFFAYYPQIFVINNIFLCIYFFARIFFEKNRKKLFIWFIFSYITTFFLTSIQLFPTVELIKHSVRARGLGMEGLFLDAFPPSKILSLFLPYHQLKITSWEICGYVGISSGIFAILSFFKKNKYVFITLALCVLSFMFMFGGYFPLYKYLYEIPPFYFFRGSARYLIIFTFTISILAGAGIDKLQDRIKAGNKIAVFIIFLIFLDLYFFSVKKNIVYTPQVEFYNKLKKIEGLGIKGFQHRVIGFEKVSLSNLNLLSDTYTVNIYSPLVIKNYYDLVFVPLNLNLIYLTSIKCIFYPDEIWYLSEDLPRIWVANKILTSKNTKIVNSKNFSLKKNEVFLSFEDAKKYRNFLKNTNGKNSVKIIEYSPQKVTIRAKLSSSGILILNDVFYPGWRVCVNGKIKKILLTNFAFRGIFLKKGENTVIFLYKPISFIIGCIVSFFATGLITYLTLGVFKNIFKLYDQKS